MFQGKNYLLTWRTGQNSFDWRSGVSFCQSQGMRLVSLDNKEKMEHFLGLLKTDRAPYFWSGGQVKTTFIMLAMVMTSCPGGQGQSEHHLAERKD